MIQDDKERRKSQSVLALVLGVCSRSVVLSHQCEITDGGNSFYSGQFFSPLTRHLHRSLTAKPSSSHDTLNGGSPASPTFFLEMQLVQIVYREILSLCTLSPADWCYCCRNCYSYLIGIGAPVTSKPNDFIREKQGIF